MSGQVDTLAGTSLPHSSVSSLRAGSLPTQPYIPGPRKPPCLEGAFAKHVLTDSSGKGDLCGSITDEAQEEIYNYAF